MVQRLVIHIANTVAWFLQLIAVGFPICFLIYYYYYGRDLCLCSDVGLLCDLNRPHIYYNCSTVDSRPTVETCPSGQLFDVFRGVCLSSGAVECSKEKELRRKFYFPLKCYFNSSSSSLSSSSLMPSSSSLFTINFQNVSSRTVASPYSRSITTANERGYKSTPEKNFKTALFADSVVSNDPGKKFSYNLSIQNDDHLPLYDIISTASMSNESAKISRLPDNTLDDTTNEPTKLTSGAATDVTQGGESALYRLYSTVVPSSSSRDGYGEKGNPTSFESPSATSTSMPPWQMFSLQPRQRRDKLVLLCKQGFAYLCDTLHRSVFYRCFNDRPYRYVCPKPLLFDSNTNSCSSARNAVCSSTMNWRHLAFETNPR